MEVNSQAALSGTVVNAKATGGRLQGVEASNGGLVSTFIQFFEVPAAEVTLGTTVPKMSLVVPKGSSPTDVGAMDKDFGEGIDFQKAIAVAATTTPAGATGAVVGLRANFFFQER